MQLTIFNQGGETIADKYRIPDCTVILPNLGKAKVFSTINSESAFRKILMKPEGPEKTVISENNDIYEYMRIPFGLNFTTSIFQRALDNIIHPYVGNFCIANKNM